MDVKRITAALLKAVWDKVGPAFSSIDARLEAMSARIDNMPRPDPADLESLVKAHVAAAVATLGQGEKVEPAQIRSWLDEMVAARMSAIPAPRDGKDADPAQIRSMVDEMIAARSVREEDVASILERVGELISKRIEDLPTPEPGPAGKDAEPVDVAAIVKMIDDSVERRMASIEMPKDGKDAEPIHPDTLMMMVTRCVREAVSEIPAPKDGKSVDLETLSALIDAKVTTAIAALPKPEPGRDGRDADMTEITRLIDASSTSISDLIDEVSSLLEEDVITASAGSNINVSVLNGGESGLYVSTPAVHENSARIEEIEKRASWPTVFIYRDGRVIGAKRVPPGEVEEK